MRKSFKISLLLALALLLAQITTVAAANSNPEVSPPNSHAYGKSYAEWSVAWWKWLFSLDTAHNPFASSPCVKTNQENQKVLFLVGIGSGTITCTITTGTALFFPIINEAVYDYLEGINDPPGDNPTSWLADLKRGFATTNVSASIDGKPVNNPKNYLVFSDPFFVTLTSSNNIYGLPAGELEMINGGYYLLLHPLSPGTHTIEFKGEWTDLIVDPGGPAIFAQGPFSVDTKYDITVVPGHK